jgi:hypothetical protein
MKAQILVGLYKYSQAIVLQKFIKVTQVTLLLENFTKNCSFHNKVHVKKLASNFFGGNCKAINFRNC